jgi:mannose-6-phosphate isomerase-like protein (cupin superfamily)
MIETPSSRGGAMAFEYVKPEVESGKKVVRLSRTPYQLGAVQVIKRGGENNLHSHTHFDGFWFVLSGRARFHGEGDAVLGEFGRYQGILIPRGVPYWFESVGDEELEVLQVESSDQALVSREDMENDRVDHTPQTRTINYSSPEA